MSWPNVTKILGTEGYRNSKGAPFKNSSVQMVNKRFNEGKHIQVPIYPSTESDSVTQGDSLPAQESVTLPETVQDTELHTATVIHSETVQDTSPVGGPVVDITTVQDSVIPEQEEPVAQEISPVLQEEPTPMTETNTLINTVQDTRDMAELLTWWRQTKGGVTVTDVKPEFRRDATQTKTVRLSTRMIKDAESKMRTDRARTGGSFNGLVEVLLWEYLDRGPEYVEQRQD